MERPLDSILLFFYAKIFTFHAKDLANSFLIITFGLTSISNNINNQLMIFGSYPRIFYSFLSPGPKSHLLSCFSLLQVVSLPM